MYKRQDEESPARTKPRLRVEKPSPSPNDRIPATVVLSFIGRSLVVLGGAFLLRWLTQSGILPQIVGSVIGFFYALLWLVIADITAGRGHRSSAVFHGVTSSFIAFPLLIEATTKFHYLTPVFSAALLLAFIVLGLVVAGRRKTEFVKTGGDVRRGEFFSLFAGHPPAQLRPELGADFPIRYLLFQHAGPGIGL